MSSIERHESNSRLSRAVVHNGVAAAEFEPVPLDPDTKDFVFIGEFRDVKGIPVLIDALTHVRGDERRPAACSP